MRAGDQFAALLRDGILMMPAPSVFEHWRKTRKRRRARHHPETAKF
jgi:uncharacterized protein HemY